MAQIRVKQIKNLELGEAINGFAALKVGSETPTNVMTSLTTVAENTELTKVVTSVAVSGNTITPKYNTFRELGLATTADITTAINALDGNATIASVTDGVVTLKAGIVETDGVIANSDATDITLAKVATTGAAEDVTLADVAGNYEATTVEAALAEVMAKVNSINVGVTKVTGSNAIVATPEIGDVAVSLKIDGSEKVLSQDTNGLKSTLTVDIANRTEGEDQTQVTYIQIKGINGDIVSEVNANAFVKDGFLQSVTKDEEANTITFTWNTDAGIETTTIAISDLCDVYTAKENDWIQLNGFEFSHKVIHDAEKIVGTKTSDLEFSYPKFTVDKAGHVIQVTEQNITIPTTETIDENDGTDLATEGAVKSYVDGQLSAQATKHVHVESGSTTINLSGSGNRYTLVSTDKSNFDVYQNGIKLRDGEFTIEGTTMTINPEVTHVDGDIYLVCYVVKATERPM